MNTDSLKNLHRAALWLCVFLYVALWGGAILNHLIWGGVPKNLEWLGSLFLFLGGAILFLTADNLKELRMLACFALFGFAVEFIGVQTGFPFGVYEYTENLGGRIAGVPAVMTFAWMTVILYAREIILPFQFPRFVEAIGVGVLVTLVDLVIDPMAVNQLEYWRWTNAGVYYNIPWTNFAGWFLTGFAAFLLFQQKSEPNVWRLRLGFSIVLFFASLALIHKFYFVAIIGGLLCLPYFLNLELPRVRDTISFAKNERKY